MLLEDDCPCGRTQRVARFSGRVDDMLIIRGINVFPSQIEHVLMALPEVGDQFMVYVDRDERHLDEMTIEVEIKRQYFSGEPPTSRASRRRSSGLSATPLDFRTHVRLVERGSLPRFEGKAKRVVDRRGSL